MIDVTSEAEQNEILSLLGSIPYHTREECVSVLKEYTLKYKIFSVLPINDSSEFNKGVITVILNILYSVCVKLMNASGSREEITNFQSQFSNADGYNTLLYILSVYENNKIRERICITLGRFYERVAIPEEGKIVIDILISVLREYTTIRLEKSFVDHLVSALGALLKITVNDDNAQTAYDKGILKLLMC
jgi:hypothetical protein